eukprot:CAMPEP_0115094934 /NCGR_PEP_ID=MMETSP0227-20121206/28687_1 /TAXON_ID=89957 /ORGANISM="Polarella glacialis, Strain CCMP 1383" /LENGTH=148 /DNA_ID=CAMNT_0002488099 /DNA_START=885 /DNA_END=1331 /DNA_ORIENTATION=-
MTWDDMRLGVVGDLDVVGCFDLKPMLRDGNEQPPKVRHTEYLGLLNARSDEQRGPRLVEIARANDARLVGRYLVDRRVHVARLLRIAGQEHRDRRRGAVLHVDLGAPGAQSHQDILGCALDASHGEEQKQKRTRASQVKTNEGLRLLT